MDGIAISGWLAMMRDEPQGGLVEVAYSRPTTKTKDEQHIAKQEE